ncbi:hypothetical protein MUK42_00664 [Musa troglodytarum]|uniref:Uncharacterized protein n=1 Tax=Musa troglodytarum TaxID=320322 RepID=A0A9E7FB36_9LILI|nr:hypothetical protein MUK42_00664 [Musa troglodytarum]
MSEMVTPRGSRALLVLSACVRASAHCGGRDIATPIHLLLLLLLGSGRNSGAHRGMDEFSFPTIAVDTDSLCRFPFPHFAASPLRLVPSGEKTAARGRPRSFSSAEEAPRTVGRRPGAEERMDVLWEDFNQEELLRRSPFRGDNVEFCCLRVLNEKKSGRVGRRRRGSLTFSMLKALKKLFSIPKASSSGRTPFC